MPHDSPPPPATLVYGDAPTPDGSVRIRVTDPPFGAYYTPRPLAEAIDPASGTGRFLIDIARDPVIGNPSH
mgnify:CR=1 FL=1